MSESAWHTASTVLKMATLCLVVIASVLWVRGHTWDKFWKRPTRLGWANIAAAACTFVVALIHEFVVDPRISDLDRLKESREVNAQLEPQFDTIREEAIRIYQSGTLLLWCGMQVAIQVDQVPRAATVPVAK